MVKVLRISEVNTDKLFKIRQFTLGQQKGKYVVVDGDLYLGIYELKEDAQEHADDLNEIDKEPTKEDLDKALEFAKNIKD